MPVMIVHTFSKGQGVELPYNVELLQSELVDQLKILMADEFTITTEVPAFSSGTVYTLDGEFKAWHEGGHTYFNRRRESYDVRYRVSDPAGTTVVERLDSIRTSLAGPAGPRDVRRAAYGWTPSKRLQYSLAQKIAHLIKDARLH